MDEKIYQRQISKLSLSDSLMDSAAKLSKSTESFTPEEVSERIEQACLWVDDP
jgi:SNF2 family DNA or RNA helicase